MESLNESQDTLSNIPN